MLPKKLTGERQQLMINTVLFDLDGTLLPVDTDKLIEAYLGLLARKFSDCLDSREFIRALMYATGKMMENRDPGKLNRDVFMEEFIPQVGIPGDELEMMFAEFYARDFPSLAEYAAPREEGREAVLRVLERGGSVVIATNPVFPERAIVERLKWIGVDRSDCRFITSYENMHFCKPYPEYFSEILDHIGKDPEECLVVGNDVDEDLIAGKLGMQTVLVKDYLINRRGGDYRADIVTTLEELPDIVSKVIRHLY